MLSLSEFLTQFDVATTGHVEGTKWHLLTDDPCESHIGFTGDSFLVFIEFQTQECDWRQIASNLYQRVGIGPNDSIGVIFRFASEFKERYSQFMREVISECGEGIDPRGVTNDLLPRWFAFWDEPQPLLDTRNQIGLYGELIVLEQLLNHRSESVLETWRSPHDNDDLHDWQGREIHLEVKTSSTNPRSIRISAIDQMDYTRASSNNLVLIIVEILENQNSGRSLTELVQSLRIQSDQLQIRSSLDELLLLYGYLDRHEAFYAARRYVVEQNLKLEIGPLTPIYTRENLRENFDSTVKKIEQLVDYRELQMTEIEDENWANYASLL